MMLIDSNNVQKIPPIFLKIFQRYLKNKDLLMEYKRYCNKVNIITIQKDIVPIHNQVDRLYYFSSIGYLLGYYLRTLPAPRDPIEQYKYNNLCFALTDKELNNNLFLIVKYAIQTAMIGTYQLTLQNKVSKKTLNSIISLVNRLLEWRFSTLQFCTYVEKYCTLQSILGIFNQITTSNSYGKKDNNIILNLSHDIELNFVLLLDKTLYSII